MTIAAPRGDRHFSDNVFREAGYQQRYDRIFSVIERHLNLGAVAGKTVIDLACGMGGFGRKFAALGAHVIYVDGREENLRDVREDIPGAETYLMNVETDMFPKVVQGADLILALGLIYHVRNPAEVIAKLSGAASEMILETNCLDHDGMALVWFTEDKRPRQFSLSGHANRPSPGWVRQAILDGGFAKVEDISHKDADQLPGNGFPGELFGWEFKRTCGWRRDECSLRKLFIASRSETPTLLKFS